MKLTIEVKSPPGHRLQFVESCASSATMEANLNQFRLLTVRSEQEANCRRGSCSGRARHPHDGPRASLAGGDSGSNVSVNGSICVSTTHDHSDHDDSAPSGRCSPLRRRPAKTHQTARRPATKNTYRDDADVAMLDDDDRDDEADDQKCSNAERSLINALRSLEKTLNDHTLQMTKRLRRELTVKGTGNDTQTSALPAKTAQRGDKVKLTPSS